jgi:hypothetical protein
MRYWFGFFTGAALVLLLQDLNRGAWGPAAFGVFMVLMLTFGLFATTRPTRQS